MEMIYLHVIKKIQITTVNEHTSVLAKPHSMDSVNCGVITTT